MGATVGSIDDRFRPLLRVEIAGDGEDILALLDTGFNGELHCEQRVAMRLGIKPVGEPIRTELAGGVVQLAEIGLINIVWLGRPRRVNVLIVPDADQRSHADGEPVALVGGALLAPSLVLLDYGAMTVEIEEQ